MNCHVLPRSHINSLPVEPLSYIFTLATHDRDSEEERASSPESVALPTVLASVNSHWRQVALSVPNLWSTLSIDLRTLIRLLPDNIFTFNRRHFDQLLSFVTRSKQSSLDIFIDARDPKSRELIGCLSPPSTETSQLYADCMPFVFAVLFLQMHRWCSLEVVNDTLKPLCAALRFLSGHTLTRSGSGAPCLEFIKLKRSNDYYNTHSQQFIPPMELDSIPFAALIGGSDQDVREQDQDILAQVPAPFHPSRNCVACISSVFH